MRIILKEEVDNLGLAGDIVDVADGYGRNYLIPRGKAIVATPGAEKEAQALLRARRAREAATLDDAQEMKDILESRVLRIEARVDERGHLYGSVGAGDVHRVLRERGHDIERKRIDLKSIKEIGEYEVPVQVHPQVEALVTVEVVDVEGEVTVESLTAGTEEPPPIVLEGEEPAEGEETDDVEVLAQQALDAARAFEEEQALAEQAAAAAAAASGSPEDEQSEGDEGA
jgi:large subunit ribosomal protein L9